MSKLKVLKTIKTKTLRRTVDIQKRVVDEDRRSIELSFSSEEPYQRWFGDEVLDHDPQSVRLDFLNSGRAPLLKDHFTDKQTGVIEKAEISGRVGRATVRFGKSDIAETEFRDVVDDIRANVSVGYIVHSMILESSSDRGDVYRVNDWEPLEVSIVSIPADTTVGVGRGDDSREVETQILTRVREVDPDHTKPIKGEIMPDNDKTKTAKSPDFDADAERKVVRDNEVKRINAIRAIGDQHGFEVDARDFIADGKDVEAFKSHVLNELQKMNLQPVPSNFDVNVGLSEKEAKNYSIIRLIAALADPQNRKAQEAAAFEFECSEAFTTKAKRQPRGVFIPPDILKRDMTVGTDADGGYLVGTEMRPGSFIDALRNKIILQTAGATFLTDLVGDLAIPKLSAGATAYWVAENNAPTEGAQTIAQVALAPKTVAAYTDLSRKLLIQSSVDVEAMVKNDLAKITAIAVDAAGLHGTGASNQPTGIAATSGIGSVAGGTNGAAPDWADIVNLETEVAVDNADIESLAYITNAKVRGKLKRTALNATYGDRYIWDTNNPQTPLNGYDCHVTNQVSSALTKGSSSGVCSAIFFGNWADVIIGLWSGIDILVDPYTGSAAATVRVTAFQDADVAVRHAESFAAMLDALTT